MNPPKTPKTPRPPKSPKTLKIRKPDKITYHQYSLYPEVGVPISSDRQRQVLFSRGHKVFKRNYSRYIKSFTPEQAKAIDKQLDDLEDTARKRLESLEKFKVDYEFKLFSDEIKTKLKLYNEFLEKEKRDQKLHDLQAKKEDKAREQAKLLKLWHSDDPSNSGETYVDDDDDDNEDEHDRPSKTSFFGKMFGYKSLKPSGLKQQERAERERIEEEASDKLWKEFRAKQIARDKSEILRSEEMIRKLKAEQAAGKYNHTPSHSGGRGIKRRKTQNARHTSTRRRLR